MKIRALIVDDHFLSRKGIYSILSASSMFEIVGEATDGLDAVEKARELLPDLILMDIRMPVCGGLEATGRIKAILPQIKIIILSVSDDVQDFFEAIKSGAQGYLLKNLEPEYWLDYITSIALGEMPVSRALAGKILQEFAAPKPVVQDNRLSEREQEVLQLISDGLSNKEISINLFLSESTVKNHLRNILDKLNLQNRMQLIAFAYKNRLVSY